LGFGLVCFGLLNPVIDPPVAGASIRLTDDPEDSTNPSVAVGPDGSAHVVWIGSGKVYYLKLDNHGQVTCPKTNIYDTVRASRPRIAVDSRNRAHVVFMASSPLLYTQTMYVGIDEQGNRLTPKIIRLPLQATVPQTEQQVNWPGVAIDPSADLPVVIGDLHIRIPAQSPWLPDQNMERITVFKLDRDGSLLTWANLWNTNYAGSYPKAYANSPAVAVDASGRVHAVWHYAEPDGTYRIGYSHWDANAFWPISGGPVPLTAPAIACSTNEPNQLHVVWDQDEKVIYTRLNTDGGLETNTVVSGDNAKVTGAAAITCNTNLVYVVWPDTRDGNREIYLRSMSLEMGKWQDEKRLTFDPGDSMNPWVIVQGASLPSVAWQDNRYGNYEILMTGVALVALEVIQAIQDWENSVPLISGKPTIARAHLETEATGMLLVLSNVWLRGFRDGAELKDSPLWPANQGATLVVPTNVALVRSNLSSNVWFSLPTDWLKGKVQLRLESTNQLVSCCEPVEEAGQAHDCCVTVNFTDMPLMFVNFFLVKWTDTNGLLHEVDLSQGLALAERLKAIYPVGAGQLRWSSSPLDWDLVGPGDVLTADALNGYLDTTWYHDPQNQVAPSFYHAVVSGAPFGGLANGIPGNVSCSRLSERDFDYYHNAPAHEIGHSLGRYHTVDPGIFGWTSDGYKIGPCGTSFVCVAPPMAPDFPWFFPRSPQGRPTLGPMEEGLDHQVYGFDALHELIVDPFTTFALMGYCPGLADKKWKWVSKTNYWAMMDALRTRFVNVSSASTASNAGLGLKRHLVVRGRINITTGAAEFLPFSVVSLKETPSYPRSGDYVLRLLDPGGQVVREVPFTPVSGEPEQPVDVPLFRWFLIPVPEDPAISQAMVLHNGASILSRSATRHVPAVTVTYPNGGETNDGDTVTLRWTGSDADGGLLTYVLQYSPDDGATWQTLAVDYPKLSYEIRSEFLRGTIKGRIRVIASDGFNTAADESDAVFTVPNHRPLLILVSPEREKLLWGIQAIRLKALAWDVEDGELGGTNVSWNSSLDGVLGNGVEIQRRSNTLSEGTHLVTVTVTDSGGLTNGASVRITVAREEPPTLKIEHKENQVVVSWSARFKGFAMESTASLSPPIEWSAVTNTPTMAEDRLVVTLPVSDKARFYRLKKQ
jgi:hypothetical protein